MKEGVSTKPQTPNPKPPNPTPTPKRQNAQAMHQTAQTTDNRHQMPQKRQQTATPLGLDAPAMLSETKETRENATTLFHLAAQFGERKRNAAFDVSCWGS